MREFIITNPNLSVGRPGDIVTADQLKMADDKLDDFVAAGHAIEVGAIANPIEWADDISDAWDDDWDDDDFTDAASGLRGAEGDSDED